MIPAYKDPVLRETLDSIFQNALYPNRVFVAIAAQYDDKITMPSLDGIPIQNIRLLTIHPNNRPGVYRIRHILNKLYSNEDYYMSIDSHTILASGWDEELILMLESFDDKKTILQAYEPEYKDNDTKYLHYQMSVSLDNRVGVPRIIFKDFSERDIPKNKELPIANYLQAGMIFTRGLFAKEIRWGKLWQDDQEEPFLSFESFMLGWTSRLMIKQRLISHEPERYYKAVYSDRPQNHNRNFIDNWEFQKDDLSAVCPQIFRAMLKNTGPFRVVDAVRSPKEWWQSIGLEKEYDKYVDYF